MSDKFLKERDRVIDKRTGTQHYVDGVFPHVLILRSYDGKIWPVDWEDAKRNYLIPYPKNWPVFPDYTKINRSNPLPSSMNGNFKINENTDKKCNRCGGDTEVIIGQFRKCPKCETTEEKFEPFEPLRDLFDFDKDDEEAENTNPNGFKIIGKQVTATEVIKAQNDFFDSLASIPSSDMFKGTKIDWNKFADLLSDSDEKLGNNGDTIPNIDPDGSDGND